MVKVPSDPAEIAANHASFRVEFPGRPAVLTGVPAGAASDTVPLTAVPAGREHSPVVWTGRAMPGDTTGGRLLQGVVCGPDGGDPPGAADPGGEAAATRVLPRIGPEPGGQGRDSAGDGGDPAGHSAPGAGERPTVVAPRRPGRPRVRRLVVRPRTTGADRLLLPAPRSRPPGAHEPGPAAASGAAARPYEIGRRPGEQDGEQDGGQEQAQAGPGSGTVRPVRREVRHAFYPGRRMNLGVVLLPLRIFLGFVSIYAGMGKLTDPVYFDGGDRGSMVSWLRSLEPWSLAAPLHDFAVTHPVGCGLTVAFLQIIVGVLTVFGLWQRLAASIGAALSGVLIMTVSWRAAPVYDAPDIIYLAAWSPLVIAGAPVYSLDGRLAGETWRRLGPRAPLWQLRRRVLRRGTAIATVLIGLTMLIGSVLGGAVRSAQVATVPPEEVPPSNDRPGSPLPQRPEESAGSATHGPGQAQPSRGSTAGSSPSPSAAPDGKPERIGGETGSAGVPGGEQTVRAPRQSVPPPVPQPPQSPVQPPSSAGGTPTGGTGDAGSTSGGDEESAPPDDRGRGDRGALGGLLG